MRVLRKDNSPTNVTLTVEGEAADLEPIHSHVLGHFKHSVKVPGFREGKAPPEMIEKYANQQRLMDEFMEHALNELYRRAIEQEGVRPLGTPNVQLKKFVPYTQLEFEAETEILGPVKLPDYKSIKLAKPKVSVSAADIEEVLKSLQIQMAERIEKEDAAENGDELVIDFTGSDKQSQKVGGAEGKDYPLLLGSKTFIPGFEDNLVGAKSGETNHFEVTFPKDYGVSGLRSKKVDFKVEVKKVQELVLPKIDDILAKKAGPFATLTELKADIKKQLTSERQQQTDNDYQNQLVRQIAQEAQLEVPKGLVEEEIKRMEEQEKQNLAYQGKTWPEHLKDEGITEEQHRERQRPDATERVKVGLILSEIAEREGLRVTPEELEIRRQILKGQYQDPQMQGELDKPENQRDIQARLLTEKTLQKLVSYASK